MNIIFKNQLVKPSLDSSWIPGFVVPPSPPELPPFPLSWKSGEGKRDRGGGEGRGTCGGQRGPLAGWWRLCCFYGRVKSCSTSKLRKAPHLTFQVSQKEYYIIKTLRDIFLNTDTLDLKNVRYDKSRDGWTFHCSSFTKLKVVINYLYRYELKTKKSISFTKWCKIHDMILNKEHLTVEDLNKIDLLTKDINKFIS